MCLDTPPKKTVGTPPNGWRSKSSAPTATSQRFIRKSSEAGPRVHIGFQHFQASSWQTFKHAPQTMSSSFFKKRLSPIKPGDPIDYKDTDLLKKFITERGKLLPRRMTGLTAKQQRDLTNSVKRARIMALLPFVNPEG